MHGRVANCAKDRAGVTRAWSPGVAPRNLTFTRHSRGSPQYLAVASQCATHASHPSHLSCLKRKASEHCSAHGSIFESALFSLVETQYPSRMAIKPK